MAVYREIPYPGMNFLVEIDGVSKTDAVEIIFPEARLEVLEYRSGNDKENAPKHLQTVTQYGTLILRRDVRGSLDWYQWWNQVRDGNQSAQRSVVVTLLNEQHDSVVLVWKFRNAIPVDHQFSPLNALGMEPFIESLELAFERLEME